MEQRLQLDMPNPPTFLLDTDDQKYGGFGPRSSFSYQKEAGKLKLSLAARTAMVFQL